MALCQLFLQSEAAYACISELGELGVVQFKDLNPTANAFQRKFVAEVRRCDEMERKLRYIEKEIKKDGIPILDTGDNPTAPFPREMIDLEATFEKLDNDLRNVTSNTETLKKNYLELTELRHILKKTQHFFEEVDMAHRAPGTSTPSDEHASLMDTDVLAATASGGTLKVSFLAGVLAQERVSAFERMLWRACRGNVFLRQAEIDCPMEDPLTGESAHKTMFIVFFQGDQLRNRVRKICEGFRATIYPCPDSPSERREMAMGVVTRIEDLKHVLSQTEDHRHRLLVLAAKNIKTWHIKVRKIKAIYHTLNLFNLDVTQKCLIAECWCSLRDLDNVQMALRRSTELSGSTVPSILNRMMSTDEVPPTYNRTNKFTSVFQSIVDAYGVATYREVNPAAFSIITFPFLFSVMFGDFGHGLVMFFFGLFIVLREKHFIAQKSTNEIWNLIFGGRYLLLMMGAFSVYAGLVYNDCFSKSLNFFGSSWRAPPYIYNASLHSDSWTEQALNPQLNTSSFGQFTGPYAFGLDPVWALSKNKITFTNSFKMKLSVILGVTHMMYGVILGAFNHVHFRNYINILCEFIPQVLFLMTTFGYLVVQIFYKWISYSANAVPEDPHDPYSHPCCAPNLLIGMINMYLFKQSDGDDAICGGASKLYDNQYMVQTVLVLVTGVCIPWILVPKPLLLIRRLNAKHTKHHDTTDRSAILSHDELEAGSSSDTKVHHGGHEEESTGDIVVHQAIHTIEYCLGCVSHTASYLRLWALSLAHGQLSEVLWNMVLEQGLSGPKYVGGFILFAVFVPWAVLTVSVLLLMEGLSAFLHTLRLHWVEFQDKFYDGEGHPFTPFSFATFQADTIGDDD